MEHNYAQTSWAIIDKCGKCGSSDILKYIGPNGEFVVVCERIPKPKKPPKSGAKQEGGDMTTLSCGWKIVYSTLTPKPLHDTSQAAAQNTQYNTEVDLIKAFKSRKIDNTITATGNPDSDMQKKQKKVFITQ